MFDFLDQDTSSDDSDDDSSDGHADTNTSPDVSPPTGSQNSRPLEDTRDRDPARSRDSSKYSSHHTSDDFSHPIKGALLKEGDEDDDDDDDDEA